MERWKKAYEDWGFSELDHRWEGFIAYGAAAAFWIHLATWLLTRESLIPAVDDLGGWLTLVVMAIPGNIRAAFLIVLGPPRRGKWKTLWLSPRTNPLNQWQSNRRQAVRAQTPSKGGSRAGTLVKVLAGLTLFAVCAGYGITGGPIVEPSDSTTSPPRLRNQAEKRHMLELINDARVRNGARPVVMGTNNVAQIRADQLLRDCILSHWGTDGLKPYMRYSLAGGYQTNGENVYTANECGLRDTWLQWNDDPKEMVRQSVEEWLESPGHRETMLDPTYRKVNIGLAWDRNTFKAVQHFEGDYVHMDELPTIKEGILTMEGKLKHGHQFQGTVPMALTIFYDPKPTRITRNQLARTHCYSAGNFIAVVFPPELSRKDSFKDTRTASAEECVDPYSVRPDTTLPNSVQEMLELHREAETNRHTRQEVQETVTFLKAQELSAKDDSFGVTVNLSEPLEEHGPGVYTVMVLASLKDKPTGNRGFIAEYSIFHEVKSLTTYSRE